MDTIKERLEKFDAYVTVGVAGDSGAGKTTFSKGIMNLLGSDIASSFSIDDYHLEDRKTRKRTGHLPLDPQYNDLDLLAEHLSELRSGREIIKPHYNHSTGEFDPASIYHPRRVMLVEGLHPFYTDALREQMDFMVFIDPVREVKWNWKLKRDVEKRGHDKEDAFREILAREPLFRRFIDIQKIYSEVVVRIEPSNYPEAGTEHPRVKLFMTPLDSSLTQIGIGIDLTRTITGSNLRFSLDFGSDYLIGRKMNTISMDGRFDREGLEELESRICDFTGTSCVDIIDTRDGAVEPSGFAQLMIVWRFLEKLHVILTELERGI